VFNSTSTGLVPGKTTAAPDIFESDLWTGQIRRVSASKNGAESNSGCFWPNVSADGNYIAFYSTATSLIPGTPILPGSTLGYPNVFVAPGLGSTYSAGMACPVGATTKAE
jgi:hypothetical protein